MKKKLTKASLMVAICCFSISMTLPGQAKAGWLQKQYKAHPVSVDQLDASWGTPVNVITIAKGVEKRIYGPKDVVIGYTYFITDNGQVIDRGVTGSTEKQAAKAAGPVAKGHMANYYAAHPVTVDELKAEWGSYISNHDYDNGIKKLTFGPKDPEVGYTYFLVKDGMVIDKKVTGAN